MKTRAMNRTYNDEIIRKTPSRTKNYFVTLTCGFPSSFFSGLALITSIMTQQEIKNTAPNRLLIIKVIVSGVVPPAEIAAKQSGAPLPRASSVTPARLSEQPSFTEMVSSAGERYMSAVEPRVYIAITRQISANGTNKSVFSVPSPNALSNSQNLRSVKSKILASSSQSVRSDCTNSQCVAARPSPSFSPI